MKAQSFEIQLQHAAPPPPDPAARLRARCAALAEFERVSMLGSMPRNQERISPIRFWSSRNALVGGIASACVVVIAVSMAWLMPPEQRELPRRVPVVVPPPPVERTPQVDKPAEGTLVSVPPTQEIAAPPIESDSA